jgi:hypothetical protein
MTVYTTAISPMNAGSHQAIASIRWLDSDNSTSNVMSKAQAVAWLREGHRMWVAAEDGPVEVRVVDGNPPYLRTVRDNTYTDNLLALPRFP